MLNNRKFLFIGGGLIALLVILLIIMSFIGRNNKPKEFNLTFWNLSEDEDLYIKAINEFEANHPETQITYVKKSPQDYLKTVLGDIAAGQGPDVLAVPNDWLPKYHDLLAPMPEGLLATKKPKKSDVEAYRDIFVDAVSQDNIIDSKIYGMPLSIDTFGLYINPQILDEVLQAQRKNNIVSDTVQRIFTQGPETWDEFSQMVQIITERNQNTITRSATALGTSNNIPSATDLLSLLMIQEGAKMTSDDHKEALFQTAQNQFEMTPFPGTFALELYTSFANPNSENYTWNGNMPDARRAFAEGQTAMLIDYTSADSEIKRINPNFNYVIYDIPQVKETANPKNFASYNTFSVNHVSKNTTLAWNFIQLLTDKTQAIDYLNQTKKTSPRKAENNKTDPASIAATWFKPDPEQSDTIFKKMIDEFLASHSAQTAVDSAASQITALLKEIAQ